MKYILLIFLLLAHKNGFCQKHNLYKAEFINTRHLVYDSLQKINIVDVRADKNMPDDFAEEFTRTFINSISYSYKVVDRMINEDSSQIICNSFKSDNRFLNFRFSEQDYLYAGKQLYKKNGESYVDVKMLTSRKDYNDLVDSVVYTKESVIISGFKCLVATSVTDHTKKYYICKDLPASINPGVMVVNSIGAILGIYSDTYTSVLQKIER